MALAVLVGGAGAIAALADGALFAPDLAVITA